MREPEIFRFTGSDSLARFCALALLFSAGVIPVILTVSSIGFHSDSLQDFLVISATTAAVTLGFRSTVVVTESRTTITKQWFGIPYWQWSAPVIDDVWFGGDWGEEDGALGVVVQLGKSEVHIGSRRTMRELHAALAPLSVASKRRADPRVRK